MYVSDNHTQQVCIGGIIQDRKWARRLSCKLPGNYPIFLGNYLCSLLFPGIDVSYSFLRSGNIKQDSIQSIQSHKLFPRNSYTIQILYEQNTGRRQIASDQGKTPCKSNEVTAILICSLFFMRQDYRTMEVYEYIIDTKDE